MQTIGRYQLVEKLGQGGMGVVYRAFDPLLQRVVAVKLIGAIEADAAVKERFFREARAAGQLAHKNIITIYDMGEHEGQPFLAMEFLEGHDLQQRMASQVPMTIARKLELAAELCEGIEYAHTHGVIHRDIKPANIFLTSTGTTKILDFGLARLITSELTNSNMMMGTLNYMAPEQVRGERADHRSDVFSTGVVLYELFGGRKAFEGDSFGATLYKILEEVPEPLRNLDATLPPAVIAIVERALEKVRDDRYPSMSEMLRDLLLYRQQYVLSNTPPIAGAPSDVTRVPSDVPRRSAIGPLSPSSGGPGQAPMLAHDAPTIAVPTPVPTGALGSGNIPAPAMSSNPGSAPPAPSPARTRTLMASVIGVAVLVVALAIWGFVQSSRNGTAPDSNPAAAPSAQETQQAIASRLEQASKALQSGDEAEAQRQAEAVLAISPGHPEASALRDRAQQAASTVDRGLASARELMTAGQFEEASRAAGEVLSVDPGNEEARRLMDDAAARSRGRGVEEARQRMISTKGGATAAGASKLASSPFRAAMAAEREAQALYKQEKMAEAVVKFAEATGLFRSAEIAAKTEAAARKERAKAEQSAPPVSEPEKPAASKPEPRVALPTPPVPPVSGAGTLPQSSSVAPPQPPPSAPPPPAPKPAAVEAEKPAPSPTALITEVLAQYEAALERKDLAALKRVWPGLSGTQESAIRSDFKNANRIEVDVVNPQITVRDTTATVRFLRRYTFDSVEGQRYESQSNTTMTLQRSGNNWTITQIQYELLR